ncbi:DUF1330 domain-containing protein [Pseudomonas viridiflava]|uniref:DUF1330 domain-containing protein n=1 Tax=Pseudomonas viridiflava TaxID=33069 RepID=UPI000F0137B9|nr:DUF1330 domain-containing protein [Pseudomonas viridiflava]
MNTFLTCTFAALALITSSVSQAQDAKAHDYLIANYDIKDEANFQAYMDAAGPLAPKFGGKVIIFDVKAKAVEGQPRSVIAVAEFPSLADAQRFYNSPEYTEARKLRIASTLGTVIMTEEYLPAAH